MVHDLVVLVGTARGSVPSEAHDHSSRERATARCIHWTGARADEPVDRRGRGGRRDAPHERPPRSTRAAAFVDEGFDLLREQQFMSMLVPSRARRWRGDPRRGVRRAGELAHGCPATSLALRHAHPPRRRPGLAPPPRHARPGAGEGRRQPAGARLDRRLRLDRVERHRHEGRRRLPHLRPQDARPAAPRPATCRSPASAGRTRRTGPRSSTRPCRSRPKGSASRRRGTRSGMRATGSHTVVLDEVFVPGRGGERSIRPGREWHPVWSTVIGGRHPADHVELRRRRRVRDRKGDRARHPSVRPGPTWPRSSAGCSAGSPARGTACGR